MGSALGDLRRRFWQLAKSAVELGPEPDPDVRCDPAGWVNLFAERMVSVLPGAVVVAQADNAVCHRPTVRLLVSARGAVSTVQIVVPRPEAGAVEVPVEVSVDAGEGYRRATFPQSISPLVVAGYVRAAVQPPPLQPTLASVPC